VLIVQMIHNLSAALLYSFENFSNVLLIIESVPQYRFWFSSLVGGQFL
jgi:hypothetical protein